MSVYEWIISVCAIITTITAIIAVIIDRKKKRCGWDTHSHPPFILYAKIMKKSRVSLVFISASALFTTISLLANDVPKLILSICALVCSICALITAIKGGD